MHYCHKQLSALVSVTSGEKLRILRYCGRADRMETTNTSDWVDAAWMFMANDLVMQWSDYNVSCLDTLGYVTTGNSRLTRRYQNDVGTHHSHFRAESMS